MSRSRNQLLGGGALSALVLMAAPALADETKPEGEASRKNPQVRTYSSVTVLSDPSQAPPLPSRAANSGGNPPAAPGERPRPASERPPREERGDGARERVRPDSVRELRKEIQEMRRDLRNEDRGVGKDGDRPAQIAPRLDGNRPDKAPQQERQPERRLERERVKDSQLERHPERQRTRND